MKRAKKGLAALLSICMLVTFLPASALAIGPEVGAEGLDEEAVAPVEEETEPVGEPAEPDNGAYSALKQAIEMLRPNGEVVRVGMGFKPLEFSINDITSWNKSIIGHMAYDSTSWRNAIRLLASGQIKVQPMITHRMGLSHWQEGFEAMAKKEAIKVIFTYDFDDED